MLRIALQLNGSRMVAVFIAVLLCISLLPSETSAQSPGATSRVGRVIGNIDGISQDGEQLFVSGWACQQGQKASILVHVFSDDSASHPSNQVFLLYGKTNLNNEHTVIDACQDHGVASS